MKTFLVALEIAALHKKLKAIVNIFIHRKSDLIVSATRRSRDIKIPLCLSAPVRKSLI